MKKNYKKVLEKVVGKEFRNLKELNGDSDFEILTVEDKVDFIEMVGNQVQEREYELEGERRFMCLEMGSMDDEIDYWDNFC